MQSKSSQRTLWSCVLLIGVFLTGGLACQAPVTAVKPTVTSLPATAVAVQPTAQAATDTPLSPAPAPTATMSQPQGPEVSEVTIYLVSVGDAASGTPVGCGDSLVAVKRPVQPTRQPIVAALNELFSIKQQFVGQSGLYNALYQSNLRVESAEVDANEIATVVLTGQVMMGGECDTPRFKGQIVETIRAVSGAQSANVLLNGKTLDQALSLK